MNYREILNRFIVKEQHGTRCKCVCPSHDDKQASLSIDYSTKERKTLIYCHAGCDTKGVLEAVGLNITDLFDYELDKSNYNKDPNIEAVYQYKDENGKVAFEKVRFKGKKFSQRRYLDEDVIWGLDEGIYYETYKGSGQWSMKERPQEKQKYFPATDPVIYNLPAVIQARENGETIFIVEGEKDADNLIKEGLVATTSFDGASKSTQKQKWRAAYNKCFEGANVIIIPDNDEPGRYHAENIANNLIDIAKQVKILELPELKEKGDVTDWLDEGNTKEELLILCDSTLTYTPSKKDILNFNFSDVGNAERLIEVHGRNIRYNPLRNSWMIWSGKHWEIDMSCKVEVLARDVIKRVQHFGEKIETIDEETQKLKKSIKSFVLKSENDSRIKAMINQTKSQPGVIIRETDKDPYILNFNNGTFNLKTGQLHPHNREDNITKLIPINYNPSATAPNWTSFLNKIFMGDIELVEYMQRIVGYSLTGSITEQCFFMCYGAGSNGKTTFLNTVQRLMGAYTDTLSPNSLMLSQNNDRARGDLAKLQGKRLVISSEPNEGQTFDESLLKALTGGDVVPVRFLYGEEFPLVAQFKLWIMTNEKPKVRGTNNGIWRRVRLIPFLYTFTDAEKIENYEELYILPEIEGILNWAIEGCKKYLSEGIKTPAQVLEAVDEYKRDMDQIQRYIDDNCLSGEDFYCQATVLYNNYLKWCVENGEHEISNVKFANKLKEKGFEKTRKVAGMMYLGIGLQSEEYSNVRLFDKGM